MHKRLHEIAARNGCSARQLILNSIEKLVEENEPQRPKRRLDLSTPLVRSTGGRIDLTNAEIHELIEFP